MTTDLLNPTEAQAAELESLLPMPEDLIPLREQKLELDKAKDEIQAQIDAIKAAFDARMLADQVQGYVLAGKVHARRSEVVTSRVDGKKLKAQLPQIFNRFLTVTKSVRVTIN